MTPSVETADERARCEAIDIDVHQRTDGVSSSARWSPTSTVAPLIRSSGNVVAFPVPALVLTYYNLPFGVVFLLHFLFSLSFYEYSCVSHRTRACYLSIRSVDSHSTSAVSANESTSDEDRSSATYQPNDRVHLTIATSDGNQSSCEWLSPRKHRAVSMFALRFFKGWNMAAAIAVATIVSCGAVAVTYGLESSVFNSKDSRGGWKMVLIIVVWSSSISAIAASYSASIPDGIVLLISQACLAAASINSYLMFYTMEVSTMEHIDTLLLVLTAAVLIVMLRVVTSAAVVPTVLVVVGDLLGMLFITAPHLLLIDFFDHLASIQLRHFLLLFILATFAADATSRVAAKLLIRQNFSKRLSVILCGRFICATVGAMAVVSSDLLAWEEDERLGTHVGTVLSAASATLVMNIVVELVKTVARPRLVAGALLLGCLERILVYAVAAIFFHPFVKAMYASKSL